MVNPYPQKVLRWRVKDILEAHGLTVYALAKRLEGRVNRNTLYQISQDRTRRADLDTLEALSLTLTDMTGHSVGVGDLFESTPDAEGDR